MVTYGTLIAILFLAVMAGLVFNAGQTITRKVEAQNAADAVAYSSGVWVARGMNALTASNHMMGELQALYVLHHSLGGKWLDDNARTRKNRHPVLKDLNSSLDNWFDGTGIETPDPDLGGTGFFNKLKKRLLKRALRYVMKMFEKAMPLYKARPIKALRPTHKTVAKNFPSADEFSTIFQAKKTLKEQMILAYQLHRVGWVTYEVGRILVKTKALALFGAGLVIAGVTTEAYAFAKEMLVWQEYLMQDGVEFLAHTTKGAKKRIPFVLRMISEYQSKLLDSSGSLISRAAGEVVGLKGVIRTTADEIANLYDADAAVRTAFHPLDPVLPLELDRSKIEYEKPTTMGGRSQWIRATYPWVTRWRTPVNNFFRNPPLQIPFYVPGLDPPLSRADEYFTYWTNFYTLQACARTRIAKKDTYYLHKKYGMGRLGLGIEMYVVKGLNDTSGSIHKSMEIWNDDRDEAKARAAARKADSLFTLMGYVQTNTPPSVAAGAVFRQENPDGVVCFSQAMIYNANHQQRPRMSSPRGEAQQPRVGWDTLNWVSDDIPEWALGEKKELGRDPVVRLNWQAKLTPVTPEQLGVTCVSLLPTKMGGPLRRSFETLILNNH